jgi:ketosteroid isomerase-like protein
MRGTTDRGRHAGPAEGRFMEHAEAQKFADRWAADWNSRDVERVLEHFADDVVFTSPVATALLGTDGVVRGKAALRDYWSFALSKNADLHFEVLGVYAGVHTVVINYRNQRGGLVCEVLTLNADGAVTEGHGTYMS